MIPQPQACALPRAPRLAIFGKPPRFGGTYSSFRRPAHGMARILVVDDEPDIRDALALLFREALQAEVDTARDAELAQQRLRERSYDAVISDYRMPGMMGDELLRWVRAKHPSTLRVLLTASAHGIEAAVRARVHLFLAKPFDPGELLDLLSARLAARAAAAGRPEASARHA
jgi:DNA-binding NtrC family response regulator